MSFIRHYFFCIARVKLPLSLRLFQINLLTFITDMPSLNQNKNLLVKILVPKLQNLILLFTKRVFLLVHSFVPNIPISAQNPKTI